MKGLQCFETAGQEHRICKSMSIVFGKNHLRILPNFVVHFYDNNMAEYDLDLMIFGRKMQVNLPCNLLRNRTYVIMFLDKI